jgi:hypothetical protein
MKRLVYETIAPQLRPTNLYHLSENHSRERENEERI